MTVRLTEKLAAWLARTTVQSGVPKDKVVPEPSEKAMTSGEAQGFLRLAGTVDGPEDLSRRKGFSRL